MSDSEDTVDRPVPVSELGYAEASAELEAIIHELDEGLVDVDVLEARFSRAIDIVETLDQRIRRAKQRVDELMPRLDAFVAEQAEPRS